MRPLASHEWPWRIGGACPVCGNRVEPVAELPWPRFRHGDWSVIARHAWTLFACRRCGLAGPEGSDGFDFGSYYASQEYADRSVPVHHVRPPDGDGMIPGYQHQVDLVRDVLPDAPSILDVGCFDGSLLRAFRNSFPDARLFGRDISESLRRYFPPDDRITFATDDSVWAPGPFDLIVFSHSLQYVANLKNLMQKCAAHLSARGRLFVQVPDLAKRPTSVLLGDLHQHFTRASLTNLLGLNSYDADVVEPTGFSRDIIMIASRRHAAHEACSVDGWRIVEEAVDALGAMARRVSDLMKNGGGHVLGTTIDAAFVASVLGDRLADFVDEAPHPPEARFLGRPVRQPASLAPGDRTFVPLGMGATALLRRLQTSYRGAFHLV